MSQVTIELDDGTAVALDDLASRYGRPVPSLVGEALRDWVAIQTGHLDAIRTGIAEADRGEAVTRDEIMRIVEGRMTKR